MPKSVRPHTSEVMSNDSDPALDDRLEPNRVKDGVCVQCESEEADEFVSCMFCKLCFHLNGCFDNGFLDILPNSCTKNFYKAINKSGKFAHRPGNFRFICDPCITKFENSEVSSTNDNIQILDNRVTNLSRDMNQVKEMLQKLTANNESAAVPTSVPEMQGTSSQASVVDVWKDSNKVQEIKSLLVVDKDVKLTEKAIEQSVTSSGIQVKGKYINKKGDTTFVLPSKKAREEFKTILTASGVSNEKISEPKQRYPAISVVGISNDFNNDNKENLISTIIKQNPSIAESIKTEGSMFEVLIVKPVKNNVNVNQAILRLSDNIRYAIKNTGNRIFCGLTSCKVYDQLYVKRCNRCQDFGHYAKECKGNICCGICSAGDHETKDCIHKDKPDLTSFVCCINCKKADLTDQMNSHQANSVSCPTYVAKQDKLKSATPYYSLQKN